MSDLAYILSPMGEGNKPLVWLPGEIKTPPIMDKKKRARLEAQGWRVGSAEEFLGLNPEETAYVELRLKLGDAVREFRKKKHLTQVQLAELLASSQSRVAKAEAADESVSLDLLIRSLLALGATHQDLAKVITSRVARAS